MRHENFCATKSTDTKTDPLTSSFWYVKRCNLTAIVGLNPTLGIRESNRVLRPLWIEFPAQTVPMHSLQTSAHPVLVPIHEFGHHFCGRALQHGAGAVS